MPKMKPIIVVEELASYLVADYEWEWGCWRYGYGFEGIKHLYIRFVDHYYDRCRQCGSTDHIGESNCDIRLPRKYILGRFFYRYEKSDFVKVSDGIYTYKRDLDFWGPALILEAGLKLLSDFEFEVRMAEL